MSLRSELWELIKRIALTDRDHEHRIRELELRTAPLRYYQVATNNVGNQGIENNPLHDYQVFRQDLTCAMKVTHTWASGNANGHQVGARSNILLKTRTEWFGLDGVTTIRVLEQVPLSDFGADIYNGEVNRVTSNVVADLVATNLSM